MIITLLLSCAAALAADTTDSTLKAIPGLLTERTLTLSGVTVQIHSNEASRALADKKELDVPDPAFAMETLVEFAGKEFETALREFSRMWGTDALPISELHVVITDLGEARKGTISETTQQSRVIHCDLRRWHKLMKRGQDWLAGVTSIHELTHVMNYKTDPEETKLHRELVAIEVELAALTNRKGAAFVESDYLARVAGPLTRPDDLLSPQYAGNGVLRHLAFGLWHRLDAPHYEAFAVGSLREAREDDAGFDAAAGALHLPLTISQLRQDVRAGYPKP